MTTHHSRKAQVRAFADLNSISYTTAFRQFDATSGRPLYADPTLALPGREERERAWAADHGLSVGTRDSCFHMLASDSGLVGRFHKYESRACLFREPTHVRDHGRAYNVRPAGGRSRLAVVTFAPYSSWDYDKLQAEVRSTAEEYDLRFRIGMSGDQTYGLSTVPVVLWNPRVLDLS
ncbi:MULTISPECIES: hypothetical protein [Microbacterium]|uniref:hypothetical protein n=1 Tax=Microbacterium TaxID=33882 RepID=UPI000C2C9440|nr:MULTISPECIES: hypothetical protein [Microbacterium]